MRPHTAFAIILLSALLGSLPYIVAPPAAQQQVLPSAPYSSSPTPEAAAYNVALFIAMAASATAIIYLLIRFRRAFKAFIAFAWFFITLGVSWAFAVKYYAAGLIPAWAADALAYAPFAAGPAVLYLIFKGRGDVAIAALSSLAGVMLTWVLPALTILALMGALAVYDLVMVYRGLLGALIKKVKERPQATRGEPPLFGLMAKVGDVSMGTGDFLVYTMASTMAGIKYSAYGPATAVVATALALSLIYVGFRLTKDLLLKRYGYAPALPIPLALVLPLLLL